ncbi:hypothetical protein FB107DRAFT_248079 [Schizophyllum commune]
MRCRQPASASDADANELVSAVNALLGSPNATTTGQPNDLLDVEMTSISQWLASARNISRGSPMPLRMGSLMTTSASLLDLAMLASTSMFLRVGPMQRRSGSSMTPSASCSAPHDASQVHRYIPGLTQPDDDTSSPMLRHSSPRHCPELPAYSKIRLLDLLQLQMPRKSVNAWGARPMIPLTTFLRPQDAMQARQCITVLLNGVVIGQRNGFRRSDATQERQWSSSVPNGVDARLLNDDFVIPSRIFQHLKPAPPNGNETELRAMIRSWKSTVKTRRRIARPMMESPMQVPPKEQRPSRNLPFLKEAPRQRRQTSPLELKNVLIELYLRAGVLCLDA